MIPIYAPINGQNQTQLTGINTGTTVSLLSSQPHGAPSDFFRYHPGLNS